MLMISGRQWDRRWCPSLIVYTCIVCVSLLVAVASKVVVDDSKWKRPNRPDLIRSYRADPATHHDVVVAVKSLNLDRLEEIVLEVSNPVSPQYGHYLTPQEVGKLVSNPVGFAAVVEYFTVHQPDVNIIWQSRYGEYITLRATVAKWEHLLQAEFHHYDRTDNRGRQIEPVLRCDDYAIPLEIAEHVDAIFMTSQLPLMDNSMSWFDTMPASSATRTGRVNKAVATEKLRGRSGGDGRASLISETLGYINPSVLETYCKNRVFAILLSV
jgi:subtilase family serine protease